MLFYIINHSIKPFEIHTDLIYFRINEMALRAPLIFLRFTGQAVAFGKSFARSHTARVLFVAGFVLGVSEVTRAGGVACGAGAVVSSGIVSSGCVAIVYIFAFLKFTRFLQDSYQIPASLANFIKALEWIAFTVSAGVRGGWFRLERHQVWLLRRSFKFGCVLLWWERHWPAPASARTAEQGPQQGRTAPGWWCSRSWVLAATSRHRQP